VLTLISPAKSLDLTSPVPDRDYSSPRLLDESAQLIDIMRDKSPYGSPPRAAATCTSGGAGASPTLSPPTSPTPLATEWS